MKVDHRHAHADDQPFMQRDAHPVKRVLQIGFQTLRIDCMVEYAIGHAVEQLRVLRVDPVRIKPMGQS